MSNLSNHGAGSRIPRRLLRSTHDLVSRGALTAVALVRIVQIARLARQDGRQPD